MYCYRIFRLFIIAFIITYFCGCLWMIIIDSTKNDYPVTFYNNYKIGDLKNMDQLILISYYALTTLSTIGYGDYFPLSDIEVVVNLVYILAGAAFFAYIMGSFIEIIANY